MLHRKVAQAIAERPPADAERPLAGLGKSIAMVVLKIERTHTNSLAMTMLSFRICLDRQL